MRQHETKRPDDMGRDPPQDFPLDQRLAHQTKLVIFEIAQSAMHELGRPGRRPTSQVIHFAEKNRITPTGGVARDAAAVDAASNDQEVENPIQGASPAFALLAISLSFWIKSQLNAKATRQGPFSRRISDLAQRGQPTVDRGSASASSASTDPGNASMTWMPWVRQTSASRAGSAT